MSRRIWLWAQFVGVLLLLPSSAFSQTIAGSVTDSSGAVVPGVTVEAASPALIEKTRTVVTNNDGRYSIVNLRPGTYAVTFTLNGFNTVKREKVELTSDFTAQINAEMGVGRVQEIVTVAASSPVVDLQNVAKPTIYSRDQMDALPTGRTPAALMQTLPGVTPGFFGSAFRGSQDSLTMVDGMRNTLMIGAGPSLTTAPTQGSMYQEFSFSTSIDSAEVGQPGLRINLIPKDGGNTFKASVFTTYTRDGWQTSNLDDALRALGLAEPPKQIKLFDINPTFGGPIVRDRLWFQSTFRYNESASQVLGSFFDADPSPFRYVASANPGINSQHAYNYTQRLTAQITPKDKVSGFYDWTTSQTPYFYSPLLFITPPPEATLELNAPNNQQAALRWTRTQTSRLLLESSFLKAKGSILNDYRGSAAPWSARYVQAPGLPTARPANYAILNLNTGSLIDAASVSDGNISHSWELRSTASYVTGSHSFKAGFSLFNGEYYRPTSVIGNAVLRLFNGAPNSVQPTLPGNEIEDVDADVALFAQDRWTYKRLSAFGGLRFDSLKSSVPDQVLPGTVWLRSLTFNKQDVLSFRDISPRLAVAYDLFGNGKTAVKAAIARYVAGETVNLTGAANPIRTIATTDTRSWTDRNGDLTIFNADGSVQTDELGPSTNLNFGTSVPGTVFDPNVLGGWGRRGFAWETNLSVQQELFPRVGLTALFYRRSLGNQRLNDNLRIAPSSFDGPFCLTSPVDPRLPGGGGQQACGLFDIKPAFLGQVQNYNTFNTNLGTGRGREDVTKGYEVSVNLRLPGGAFLTGGINLQDVYAYGCDFVDSPEVRFCETHTGYRPDFKLNGSYILPLDVQISVVYQGLAGPGITASWAAPGALVTPALGRPLAAGATQTKTVALVEPGALWIPMRHLFDVRLAKNIKVDRYRFQVMLDLFNTFNNNSITAINTTFGPSWQLPAGIVSPRQVRIGAQFDF